MIFHEGWDLPIGEAFVLLESDKGRNSIRTYFDRYLAMAVKHGIGFVLESPTWRANPDWAAKAGYGRAHLAQLNRDGIALMREVRGKYESSRTPTLISGNIGPRGDGYDPSNLMSPQEAADYHGWQIGIFREENVDCVSAFTLTNVNEALGVAQAAKREKVPCVISFTLETDGRLPTGETLGDAIEAVDGETGASPKLYRFFVSEFGAVNETFVNRVASVYLKAGGSMREVMREVLSSPEFWDASAYFARYSWPLEFITRAFKDVGWTGFSVNDALTPLSNMGQILYEPPDVSGWDLGQSWFSTSAMLARMNFASALAANQKFKLAATVKAANVSKTPEALLSYMLDALVSAPLDGSVTGELSNYLHATGAWTGSDAQLQAKAPGLVHLIAGSPEYQLA
jgi:hypothetical protein